MTSKLVVLALMSTTFASQVHAVAWNYENLSIIPGYIVLSAGSSERCDGKKHDVWPYARVWYGTPDPRLCGPEIQFPANTSGRIAGNACGVTGWYEFDGKTAKLSLNEDLWGCGTSSYLYADLPVGRTGVAAYYYGGGYAGNMFNVSPTNLTIKAHPTGFWKTAQVTLTGVNLSTVSVVSNRELTVNVGDEELQLKRDLEVSISPAKRDKYYRATLKMYFYGETAEKGTTQYSLRFNATYL